MSEFIIRDCSGHPCVYMDIIEYDIDIYQLKYRVSINYKEFTAKEIVYNELVDLEMLNEALSEMSIKETSSYEYKPMIDEHLTICFNKTAFGIINIDCQLSSEDYTCKTQVRFDIDQTFLPDICNQIRRIITRLKDNKHN